MNGLVPAPLLAYVNYYVVLWRTPCLSISLLLFASHSRILLAWWKAVKWLQRVVFQQSSELERLCRLRDRYAAQDSDNGTEGEADSDTPVDGDDEIRLLHDYGARELQRDLYTRWRADYSIGHSETLKDTRKLIYPTSSQLRPSDGDLSDHVATICSWKRIRPRQAPRISATLGSLQELHTTLQSTILLDSTSSYASSDSHYQRSLKVLWKALHYDAKKATLFDNIGLVDSLSPVATKEWQDIGFQGSNPTTDWRSSGKLGLKCMLYFGELYAPNGEARSIVKEAVKGVHDDGETLGWYPFALSYITVIDFLLRLIPLRSLSYIFLSYPTSDIEQTFYHLSALLVRHFHEHWVYLQTSEHPVELTRARPVVMDYERISKKWKIEVKKWLERGKVGGWVDSRGLTFLDWGEPCSIRMVPDADEKEDLLVLVGPSSSHQDDGQ